MTRATLYTGLILLTHLTAVCGQPTMPPYPPPGMMGFPPNQGIDIRTDQDDKGYYLIIRSPRLAPTQIKVTRYGDSLAIEASSNASREVTQTDPNGGSSYYRSYSYSSGSSNFYRRLPLPPDADSAAMVREDGDHQVSVFIPRKTTGQTPPAPQ